MGVVGAAIKFIAIPIVFVVLVALVIIFLRSRKKRSKDIEQADPLPSFNVTQPPSYNGLPAKPPPAVVQSTYRVN